MGMANSFLEPSKSVSRSALRHQIDIVVGAQSRNASRRFEGTMADVVETSDQWFQLYRVHLFLVSSKDVVPGGRAAHRLS
jgi:hypothetical protein